MVAPTQIDCDGNGWLLIVGKSLTITVAVLEVVLVQPPDVKVTTQ
jgi:hypothetical protein